MGISDTDFDFFNVAVPVVEITGAVEGLIDLGSSEGWEVRGELEGRPISMDVTTLYPLSEVMTSCTACSMSDQYMVLSTL